MEPQKNQEQCCTVKCDVPLNQDYWNSRYQQNDTGWDLGEISGPIKNWIDTLEDKNQSILIPGCGNTYEAQYLLEKGFKNITVIDIAPVLVEDLKNRFLDNHCIHIVLGDFFKLQGSYDLIIEQTFFCALPPSLRPKYVWKMHQLLKENGRLCGLLFDTSFEVSPPFGGSKKEYESLFSSAFEIESMEIAQNSAPKRQNQELFIEFKKNSQNLVNFYQIQGITCSGCMKTVTGKIMELQGAKNVQMSSDFSEILLVSEKEISLTILQELLSYDKKYNIEKVDNLPLTL
ncbi:MAG: thiopurine S-methyltransferase [Flavobacteriaceae bacterium]|nr:MAG: thiopurine S-methyltransferase [Flavobacteriaceae bacterium]